MDQQNSRGIDRRALLTRGGAAVAAGAIGATVAGVVTATPAYAAGLGYTPITPYRSIDSRDFERIARYEVYALQVITDMNDVLRVPETAQAVTFNLTVTQTGTPGYLGVFPGGTPDSGFTVSTINWVAPNLDLANGGTTKVAVEPGVGNGSVLVYCDGVPDTSTHFILDVTGYFSP